MNAWQPTTRLPDPAVRVLDPRFEKYVLGLAKVERHHTGTRWAEGPVWFGDQRSLYWSDVPSNTILRWDEQTGHTMAFRAPSNYSNGNTRDTQGRLVTCEHGTRRVTRTEHDGSITVIADSYDGKPLNSPNDVIVHSDGSVWFSDPPFGIGGDYEGFRAEAELPTNLYRIDGQTGQIEVASSDLRHPNGLAFSPDESVLYVVESRGLPRRKITAFDIRAGRIASAPRLFIDAEEGIPDGFRLDEDGNLWCGWSGGEGLDGVRIYAPDGDLIGMIDLPERCANVAFGGRSFNRLFMTATSSLYSLYVNTRGLITPAARGQ